MAIKKFTHIIRKELKAIVKEYVDLLRQMPEFPGIEQHAATDATNFLLLLMSHLETPEFMLHLEYVDRIVERHLGSGGHPAQTHLSMVALRDHLLKVAVESPDFKAKALLEIRQTLTAVFDQVSSRAFATMAGLIQKRSAGDSAARAREVQSIITAFDFPVIVLTSDLLLIYANRKAENTFGISTERYAGRSIEDINVFAALTDNRDAFSKARQSFSVQRVQGQYFLLPGGESIQDVSIYPYADNLKPTGFVLSFTEKEATKITPLEPGRAVVPDGAERFGAAVRRVRRASGMTIAELADQVALSRGYFSNIERSIVIPAHSAMERIAAVLDPDGGKDLLLIGAREKAPAKVRDRFPAGG